MNRLTTILGVLLFSFSTIASGGPFDIRNEKHQKKVYKACYKGNIKKLNKLYAKGYRPEQGGRDFTATGQDYVQRAAVALGASFACLEWMVEKGTHLDYREDKDLSVGKWYNLNLANQAISSFGYQIGEENPYLEKFIRFFYKNSRHDVNELNLYNDQSGQLSWSTLKHAIHFCDLDIVKLLVEEFDAKVDIDADGVRLDDLIKNTLSCGQPLQSYMRSFL